MAVYVDDSKYPFKGMIMCHMVADSVAELHTMAELIGIARNRYQGPPKTRHPHYDLCQSKRMLAIQLGAIEKSSKDLVRILRRQRCSV